MVDVGDFEDEVADDSGVASLVDSDGDFCVTVGEFMIVNEPGGFVGLSEFGFVIASRCIRNALSNCSLAEIEDGAGGDDWSDVAFVSAAAASDSSAGCVGVFASCGVDISTGDVTLSSIPLALANRMLECFLEATCEDVHNPAERDGVRFHVPEAGLMFPMRAANAGADCCVAICDVIGPVDFLLRDVEAAVNSSENAGDSCTMTVIIASDAKMRRAVLSVSE